MSLSLIKDLYNLLTTSDNIFDIRRKLHNACDKVDFDELSKEYLASENVIRMIKYIKKEYDSMIEAEKTIYKISDEELANRINKLKKMDEIFKTYDNPYIRFDMLSKMFKNPNFMHKSYILLMRYGKDDPKLDEIRPLLRKFPIYYNEFRESFKNEVHKTVANAYKEQNDFNKLNYAKFIANEYIKSEDSFMLDEFLNRYGIDKNMFESIIEFLKKNDEELYYEYVLKYNKNEKGLNNIYMHLIDDISYAITNGEFVYGNRFDELEFIKIVPFKDEDDFVTAINDFMSLHNPFAKENVLKYIKENHFDRPDTFKIYDEDNYLHAKILVSGVELDISEIKRIISYLKSRDIPLYKCAFGFAARMLINNCLPKETIIDSEKSKEITPILIPSNK